MNTPRVAHYEQILRDMPRVHRGEGEVQGPFDPQQSILDKQQKATLMTDEYVCWGIDRGTADYLFAHVSEGAHTLETGSGISTLIFALNGAQHTVVTPNAYEQTRLREYAERIGLDMSRVTFVHEPSEHYLPRCTLTDLDLVLIDGKHAFPWPMIDWFYTAERLKSGGVMILDDIGLAPVAMLCDVLRADTTNWQLVHETGKAVMFARIGAIIHDVAWHMQPYVARHWQATRKRPPLLQRVAARAKQTTRALGWQLARKR